MGSARKPRSAHPGVFPIRDQTRAKWFDPDTSGAREFTFALEDITTHDGRRKWMIRKSNAIAARKLDLKRGAARHTGESLAEAVETYFDTKAKRLKPRTVSTYRTGANCFLDWAKSSKVKLCDDLKPPHLAVFVEWLAARPAKAPVKGGGRRERAPTDKPCSPGGVNNRIRSVKTIINHLRRLGRLPHITSDDVKDCLKTLPEKKNKPKILRRLRLKQLLRAALSHDAETFDMTREEKKCGGKGDTPKYDPIAPFVAFVLLSGMRREEALTTSWATVDLKALDDHGAVVGEIQLDADVVKTGHERRVDLAVSPALRRLLIALKLRAGSGVFLFGGADSWGRSKVDSARTRLIEEFGAPPFNWAQTRQDKKTPSLRATCGSHLVNAPGIYGAASVFHAAQQLGHSIAIAERHYLGVIRGIPRTARTVEAAMGIEKELREIIERVTGGPSIKKRCRKIGNA